MKDFKAERKAYANLQWMLFFFVTFINLIASVEILRSGSLLGSYSGTEVTETGMVVLVFLATTVLISFVFITHDKALHLGRRRERKITGVSVNLVCAGLQMVAFVTTLVNGVSVVGSEPVDIGPLKYFLFAFPPDAVFLLCYALHRSDRFFFLNALIYLASNLYRGWTGVFAVFLLFEGFRLIRARRATVLACWFAALLIMYPLILGGKWWVRSGYQGTYSDQMAAFFHDGYFNSVERGFSHLYVRMEQVSPALGTLIAAPQLSQYVERGTAYPLWQENRVSTALMHLGGDVEVLSLSTKAVEADVFENSTMVPGRSAVSLPVFIYTLIGDSFDIALNALSVIFWFSIFTQMALFLSRKSETKLFILYVGIFNLVPGWMQNVSVFVTLLAVYIITWRILQRSYRGTKKLPPTTSGNISDRGI